MKSFTTLGFLLLISFFTQAQIPRYSVVINELMADPSPVVGLPNAEFIELRNNSKQTINLYKWRISNGSTTASIALNYVLGPDSIVVICSKTQAVFFNGIPNLIGVSSFPSLANDGDLISLIAADGTTMHAVSYSISDYHNTLKANGGWSLEMIDPFRGCDKNNWTASTYYAGGTPGKENSAFKQYASEDHITALQAITIDSTHIQIHLDQGVDSVMNANPNIYSLSPLHDFPSKVMLHPPLFNTIELQFNIPLQDKIIYQVSTSSLKHCSTHSIDSFNLPTGIIHEADKNDLVINEILFDPPSGGSDFIEVYNRSTKIINARHLYIANRTAANLVGTILSASESDYNIFPGAYICLTTDSSFIHQQWPLSKMHQILQMKSMPSYPDDEGSAVLLNRQGEIIDEMKYNDNMHFPLIRNREGVSLEKMDPTISSNHTSNWHSAASSVGFATPGFKNSQYQAADTQTGVISISSDLITPNNDGTDDNLTILYHFPSSGYMCTVYVFDHNGLMIQKISDNVLCGIEGKIIWDGTTHSQKALPGLYYIKLEAFHLNGSRVNRKWAVGVL